MSEKWKDRKILVTGGGGFIGSRLVEVLMRSGAQVRAFVRYNSRGDSRPLAHAFSLRIRGN